MPTKRRATHQSPAASANDTAPLSTAPTTASAVDEVTRVEMTRQLIADDPRTHIEMTRQPTSEIDYSQFPEKTQREMMAGKDALIKTQEMAEHVSTLVTQTAEEMFSKVARDRLFAKHKIDLSPGTGCIAQATLDVAKHEWRVTLTVSRAGVPDAVLTEPFVQFPSDEMIAWLMLVG